MHVRYTSEQQNNYYNINKQDRLVDYSHRRYLGTDNNNIMFYDKVWHPANWLVVTLIMIIDSHSYDIIYVDIVYPTSTYDNDMKIIHHSLSKTEAKITLFYKIYYTHEIVVHTQTT